MAVLELGCNRNGTVHDHGVVTVITARQYQKVVKSYVIKINEKHVSKTIAIG